MPMSHSASTIAASDNVNPNVAAAAGWRSEDAPLVPVTAFRTPADIIEALLQSVQGGEKHVRPLLELLPDSQFLSFIEIGYALRACLEDQTQRDYLLQRLRPHLDVLVDTLPANIKPHGMLPRQPAPPMFRPLAQIDDAELRQWLIDDAGLVYGELARYELDNLFDVIAPLLRPDSVMIDLGSGLGKVVMSAALVLPLRRCIGVEHLGYRHRMAQQRLHNLLALAERGLAALPQPLAQTAPLVLPASMADGQPCFATGRHLTALAERIGFIEGDMFDADVGEADFIFLYSTCFGPQMDALADKLAHELREGALVSTTTYPLRHPGFTLRHYFPAGTVAWTSVMVYERSGALAGLPPADLSRQYMPDAAEWEQRARRDFMVLDRRAAA